MKKNKLIGLVVIILGIFLTFGVIFFNSKFNNNSSSITNNNNSPQEIVKNENSTITQNSTGETNNKSKSLIVYYSETSNTKTVADEIQKQTQSDILKVEAVKTYPKPYKELISVALDELNRNVYPEIKTTISNLKDYDTVYIGYPIRRSHIPRPLATFLRDNNMSDKKIITFCTHKGSGFGNTMDDIEYFTKSKDIIKGECLWSGDFENLTEEVKKFVQK